MGVYIIYVFLALLICALLVIISSIISGIVFTVFGLMLKLKSNKPTIDNLKSSGVFTEKDRNDFDDDKMLAIAQN